MAMRSLWNSFAAPLALGCLALLLQSCGGSDGTALQAGPAPAAGDLVGPGAPRPAGLPTPAQLERQAPGPARSSSTIDENGLLRGGDDFDITHSLNLAVNGANGDFSPAPGGTLADDAWGIYIFDAHDYDRLATLRLRWDTAPAIADLWVAAANFQRNRWDWIKPDSRTLIPFDGSSPLASYISPSGQLAAVILLTGNQAASLAELRLGDPQMSAGLYVDSLTKHSTVWANAGVLPLKSSSTIATGSIVNYEWDLDGDGDFETDTDATDNSFSGTINLGWQTFGLRITSDWGTQATAARSVQGINGAWSVYTLTSNVNSGNQQTIVGTPKLLGSRTESGELPLIVWAQEDIIFNGDPPDTTTSIKCLLGDDPTMETWTPQADVTSYIGQDFQFKLEDAERLADGTCGLLFRDTSGSDALAYLHSLDSSGSSWQPLEEAFVVSGGVDANGGGDLATIQGDLYCAYSHGGNLDVIRNSGTTSPSWGAPSNALTSTFNLYAYYRPAIAAGLDANDGVEIYLPYCNYDLSNVVWRPNFFAASGDFSSFLYSGGLEPNTSGCQYMSGASYASMGSGLPRAVFAWLSSGSSLMWCRDRADFLDGGQLTQSIGLGDYGVELSMAGSLDNRNNLADAMLAWATPGGGLSCYTINEDSPWSIPGPDGSSAHVEPTDPGDAGSQPCCAWIQGRPAIVYIDYATQDIKFAIMN